MSAKSVNLCNGSSIFIPRGAKGNIKQNRHILTVRQAGRPRSHTEPSPSRVFSILEYAKKKKKQERERRLGWWGVGILFEDAAQMLLTRPCACTCSRACAGRVRGEADEVVRGLACFDGECRLFRSSPQQTGAVFLRALRSIRLHHVAKRATQ